MKEPWCTGHATTPTSGSWNAPPKVGRAERDDVEWEQVEFTRDLWITLRDLLWRKYQRSAARGV